MNVSDWATFVIALSTVIYTVGTLLLWGTTKRTASLIKEQVELESKAANNYGEHSALDAHRELFLAIMKDESLVGILSKELNLSTEDTRRKFLGILMINNMLRTFMGIKRGVGFNSSIYTLDALDEDTRMVFGLEFVRNAWKEVQDMHPVAFRNYINNLIEYPKNTQA